MAPKVEDTPIQQKKEELWEALQEQDTDTVKHILCHGVKVNCKLTDNHITPLHYCAQVGDEELFKWLLLKGASVKKRDRWMDTVLHYACKYNHVSIVQTIVSVLNKNTFRKCLLVQGKEGHTPEFWVVKNRNFELFKHIVEASGLTNVPELRTQLIKIIVLNANEKAELRIQIIKSIVLNANEKDQVVFIDLLFGSDKMPLFKEISKCVVDQHKSAEFYNVMQNIIQNFSQEDKEKCVEHVASTGSVTVLKMLLDNPIGYSVKCIKTSLLVAIEQKHYNIAEMLIDAGPDVEYEEQQFITCFQKGNSHLLKKMLCVTRTFPFWSEESHQRLMYAAVRCNSEESVHIIGDTLGTDFIKSCSWALDLALDTKSLHLYKYFKDKGLKLSDKNERQFSNSPGHQLLNLHSSNKHPMVLAAETGQLEFVNMLISDNVVPQTKEDCVEVIKAVVEKKQDANIIEVLLPLMEEGILNFDDSVCVKAIMTKNVNFVKMLMRHDLKLNLELKRENVVKTVLHAAVQTGVYEMVELCCQAGAVITKRGVEMEEAIRMNCLDILQLLLRYRGREIFEHFVQDRHEWSPLHEAVNQESKRAVEMILDCDNLVDIISQVLQENGTPLVYLAVEKKNRIMMQVLLENGAELNEPDHSQYELGSSLYGHRRIGVFQLLLCASKHTDSSVLSLLIKHGAKINTGMLKRFSRETEVTNADIWKEIVSTIPESDTANSISDILYEACCANNVTFIQAILEKQNFVFDDKVILKQCMYHSISQTNIQVLKLLLKIPNVDVNEICFVKSKHGSTPKRNICRYGEDIRPLHIAADKSIELCKVLLEHRADLNLATEKGILPIQIAVRNCNTDITACFIEHQATLTNVVLKEKLEKKYNPKSSLLHIAVKLQDIDTVKLLLDKSGHSLVNIADSDLKTPLFYIAKWVNVDFVTIKDVVKMFIDAGADVNHVDKNGHCALVEALQEDNSSLFVILLNSGVKTSIVQSLKWHHVKKCIRKCQYDVIKALLSCGYNLRLQITENSFSLSELPDEMQFQYLSEKGDMVAMIKCLIENGAEVEDFIELEECVRNNWVELAQVLIDHGAEVDGLVTRHSLYKFHLYTEEVISLLDMSLQKGYFEMTKLLCEAGATFNSSDIIIQIVKAVNHSNRESHHKYEPRNTNISDSNIKVVCEIIDTVISKGAEVNGVDAKGQTALHLATEANLVWFVEELLQSNCNVDATTSKRASYPNLTALQIACKIGHFKIAQMLIEHGASCVFADTDITLIHYIAKKQSSSVKSPAMTENFSSAIEDTIDIEYCDDGTGFKCFNLQEDADEEAILLQLLVNKGVDIDAVNKEGWTALHYAVDNDDLPLTKKLVALKCNIEKENNSSSWHGRSFKDCRAIQIAAKKGFINIVNYLVERGCDVTVRDTKGRTILHDVIEHCKGMQKELYSCVEKLEQAGIDLNTKDNDGKTAVNYAVRENDHKMVELLLNYRVDLTSEEHSSFLMAAEGQRLEIMKSLLEYGAAVDVCDSYGNSALQHLCKKIHHRSHVFQNYNEAVCSLISRGVNINAQNKRNETPIQTACNHGNLEALKILIQHGKDARLCTKNGKSYIPTVAGNEQYTMARLMANSLSKQLLARCLNKDLISMINQKSTCSDIIKLLLRMGANPNHKFKSDNTVLHIACKSGANIEILHLLLSFNANINSMNTKKETPLHMACSSNNTKAMKILVKCGSKTDVQDKNGWTPLHVCVHKAYRGGVELLMKYKGNLDIETNTLFERVRKGSTPLMICLGLSRYDSRDIAKILIENGANPNVTDKNGNNILLLAVERSYGLTYIESLGQNLPDINHQNNKGWGGLHHAVTKRSIDIVNFLLKRDCNVNIQINDKDVEHGGETALHMAFKMCHLELLELLLKSGANLFLNDETGKTPVQYCLDSSQTLKVDTIKCIILAIRSGGHIEAIDGKKYFDVTKDREQVTDMLIQSGCKIMFNNPGLDEELDEIRHVISKQQQPLTLMRLAANVVRTNVRPNALHSAKQLPLPESVIKYLTFENESVEVQPRSEETMSIVGRHLLAQLVLSRASNLFGFPTVFDYDDEYYDDDDYGHYFGDYGGHYYDDDDDDYYSDDDYY